VATGVTASAAEPIALQSGPLSMVFEPDNAFLRYIKLGNDEVLRGISAPVRNEFWGTVPPQVKIVSLQQQDDQFELKFDVTCREHDVDFVWHGTIKGDEKGTVEYTFDGQALADFKRNRIGFCVLHGETAAGKPWVLETTAGKKSEGRFPTFIAPHQPAKDLAAVSHEFAPGRWARVQFAGDVFEMEDQRNWTDASFKTYCTPLEIPYPVELTNGTKVQQKITISLDGDIPAQAPKLASGATVTLTTGKQTAKLPGIGLQMSSQTDTLSPAEIDRLQQLRLDHLRVDLTLADEQFTTRLSNAAAQAKSLNTKLLAAVHLGKSPEVELQRLVAECASVKPNVAVWLVITTERPTFELARRALKPLFPDAWIGIGFDTNFTELNRNRPDLQGVEFVAYGMNPQVHAFDNASMIETLSIQGDTVRSARHFLGEIPIMISPVTLRVQALNRQPAPGELPANVDPRQASLFAAAWTLGSVKYLAEADVNRVTYYETVGWKGVMALSGEATEHAKFPASAGEVYPVYQLLRAIAEFSGGEVTQVNSSDAARIVALSLKQGDRQRLLIANLTNREETAGLNGFSGNATVMHLKPNESVVASPPLQWQIVSPDYVPLPANLALPPHGIAKIDLLAK
jgi:hypothetical protein